MKIIILILIILTVFFPAGFVLAAPNVSSVSGSVVHGHNITISGTEFGTKYPAAPYFWDDGEHNYDIATKYCNGVTGCVRPQIPFNFSGNAAIYNMQYRTSSYRGLANPHSRGNRFMAGTHYDNRPLDNYTYDSTTGSGVAVTIAYNQPIRKAYLSYYMALSPDWPQDAWKGTAGSINWSCENFKERVWEGVNGFSPYGGTGWAYYGFSGCTTANSSNRGTPSHSQFSFLDMRNNVGGTGAYCYTNSNYCTEKSGIIGNWAKLEDIQDQTLGVESMLVHVLTGQETYEQSAVMDFSNSNITTHYGDRYNITLGGYYCKQTQTFLLSGWTGPDSNGEWSATLVEDQFLLVKEAGATDVWYTKGTVGSLNAGQWGWLNGRAYIAEDPAGNSFYVSNSQCAGRFSNEGSGAGGHYAHAAVSGNRPSRYFDDVYFDPTYSRVVLANNQNYSQATIIEPQIPSAWSGNSITAKVNLGKLPDIGTVYFYIFDADNNHNEQGFPVTLGGSSGDTTPPASPTGLLVQ